MVSLVLPPQSGSIPIAVVLRRARALVGARPRGRQEFLDRRRRGAVARDEARHEGAVAGAAGRGAEPDAGAGGRAVAAARRTIPGHGVCGRFRRRSETERAPAAGVGQASARRRPSSPTGSAPRCRSAQSASSLQLALENEKLVDAQKGYVKALKAAGESRRRHHRLCRSPSTASSTAPTSTPRTACSGKCGPSC